MAETWQKACVISQTTPILLEAPLRRFQRCAGVRFSLRKLLEAATYDSIFSRGLHPRAPDVVTQLKKVSFGRIPYLSDPLQLTSAL